MNVERACHLHTHVRKTVLFFLTNYLRPQKAAFSSTNRELKTCKNAFRSLANETSNDDMKSQIAADFVSVTCRRSSKKQEVNVQVSASPFQPRNHGNGVAEDPFKEKGAAFVAETGSYYDKEQSNFQALQTDLIGRREKEQSRVRYVYLIVVKVPLK